MIRTKADDLENHRTRVAALEKQCKELQKSLQEVQREQRHTILLDNATVSLLHKYAIPKETWSETMYDALTLWTSYYHEDLIKR
jgi:hypothetical protein